MFVQAKDTVDFGCCRYCPTGKGQHKLKDEVQNCIFYLCDEHLAEYKAESDDIQSNIDKRAEIAAALSPAGKDEVQ